MKPTLLILAGGLGSRYGSCKQIDKIGPSGERIIDYSVFDAARAGFDKVVYLIRENIAEEFKEVIIGNIPSEIKTEIAFQEIENIPIHLKYNKERTKPWGTGHALLSAKEKINEPFLVINADDFYGADAFEKAYLFLQGEKSNEYALLGYKIQNTLSDYGSVSRGVCEIDQGNYLKKIVERTKIFKENGKIQFYNTKSENEVIAEDTIVSMNMFAFRNDIFKFYEIYFEKFIEHYGDSLTKEFFLPAVIDDLIVSSKVKVKVVDVEDSWFGLTYPEDKELVKSQIAELVRQQVYPENLWSEFKK